MEGRDIDIDAEEGDAERRASASEGRPSHTQSKRGAARVTVSRFTVTHVWPEVCDPDPTEAASTATSAAANAAAGVGACSGAASSRSDRSGGVCVGGVGDASGTMRASAESADDAASGGGGGGSGGSGSGGDMETPACSADGSSAAAAGITLAAAAAAAVEGASDAASYIGGKKRRRMTDAVQPSQSPATTATIEYNGVLVPTAYWVQRSALWHRFRSHAVILPPLPVAPGGPAEAGVPLPPRVAALHGDIVMDTEGWYSVTPEALARNIAGYLLDDGGEGAEGCCVGVLDACCGCGGNTVAFLGHAATRAVIALDINPDRLLAVAANATVYGYGGAPAAAWPHTPATTPGTPGLILLRASLPALLATLTSHLERDSSSGSGGGGSGSSGGGGSGSSGGGGSGGSGGGGSGGSGGDGNVTAATTPTTTACGHVGIVTLENVVGARRGGGGGIEVCITCPATCCTATVPLSVAFAAPPWGGPDYDSKATACSFDAAVGIVLDGTPYATVAASMAALFPASMHYLPRHTDAPGFDAALRATGDDTALHTTYELACLEGRRRPTALLATVRRLK